uniref:Uncharacterized protein LOC105036550 n=1 Tax=Elaeis guineensis var. tenera TaxID=51953 RepID=A0A6I9QLS2_ELAGV
MVLIADEYKYVLYEPSLEVGLNSSEEEKEAEKAWKKADQMARCYMLAFMSNVLQSKHKKMDSAYNIMRSLTKIFTDKSRPAKQATLRDIMNTRIAEGGSVREHMLKMIAHFNEAKILGANIDIESQIDMVPETLSESFSQFKLNYNMRKMNMTLPELMKELQAVEAIMMPKSSIHLVQFTSSELKPEGKKFIKKGNSNMILVPLTMSVTLYRGSGRQEGLVR